MNNLGSAGCRNSDGSFCEKTLNGFFCSKHWFDLETNWSGEPYRAMVCCCDAMQDGWSKILKTKR